MLTAVDADAQGDNAAVPGEVDTVDHDRHQIQAGEIRGRHLAERYFGGAHEPSRHRRARRRAGDRLDGGADWFEPRRVAAGRELGHHPLQSHRVEQLGPVEQLIRGHRHLGDPVRAPHATAAHRHASAPERDGAGLAAMTHRRPFRVVAALRAAHLSRALGHQHVHDLQARPHGQRQQPLLHVLGELGHRHAHPIGHHELGGRRGRGLRLVVLLHGGGPFAVGVLANPTPTSRQVSGGGTPPQLPRLPGQPPRHGATTLAPESTADDRRRVRRSPQSKEQRPPERPTVGSAGVAR